MFGPELVDPNAEINFDDILDGSRRDFFKNANQVGFLLKLFSGSWSTSSKLREKGSNFNYITHAEFNLDG